MSRLAAIRWRVAAALCWCVLAVVPVGCSKLFGKKDDAPKYSKSKDKEPKIEDRPATPKTVYAFARILLAQGQYAECDALLTNLIAQHPKFRAAYLLQAEARMRQRRVDDAMDTLWAALRWSPKDDVIMNDLGMCYLMKSDCLNALYGFTAAAARAPANARYRANMALALGLMGRNEESMSLYAMVVPPSDAQHNVSVVGSARGAYFSTGEPMPWPPTEWPFAEGGNREQEKGSGVAGQPVGANASPASGSASASSPASAGTSAPHVAPVSPPVNPHTEALVPPAEMKPLPGNSEPCESNNP